MSEAKALSINKHLVYEESSNVLAKAASCRLRICSLELIAIEIHSFISQQKNKATFL